MRQRPPVKRKTNIASSSGQANQREKHARTGGATNTGIAYELITQQIFKDILNQGAVETVDVRHDVRLAGKTLTHQIDVYWEFEKHGIRYRNIVQVKDWNTPVTQGALLEFRRVLDELPGQPRGIVVTRTGYQSGAKHYAEANGIVLYTLSTKPIRAPTVIVLGGYVTLRVAKNEAGDKVEFIEAVVYRPTYESLLAHVSATFLSDLKTRFGPDASSEIAATFTLPANQIELCDRRGAKLSTLQDLFSEFVAEMRESKVLLADKRRAFAEPTFLRTSSPIAPFMPIDAISVTIKIRAETQELVGPLNFVECVLKDLDEKVVHRVQRPMSALVDSSQQTAVHEKRRRRRG